MIKYNVDRENGIVTATIDGCANDALNHVNRRLKSAGFAVVETDKLKMKDAFTAKAKCHPDDEFNEDTGKEIARSRVLDKYHANRVDVLQKFEQMASFMDKTTGKAIQKSISNYN